MGNLGQYPLGEYQFSASWMLRKHLRLLLFLRRFFASASIQHAEQPKVLIKIQIQIQKIKYRSIWAIIVRLKMIYLDTLIRVGTYLLLVWDLGNSVVCTLFWAPWPHTYPMLLTVHRVFMGIFARILNRVRGKKEMNSIVRPNNLLKSFCDTAMSLHPPLW